MLVNSCIPIESKKNTFILKKNISNLLLIGNSFDDVPLCFSFTFIYHVLEMSGIRFFKKKESGKCI